MPKFHPSPAFRSRQLPSPNTRPAPEFSLSLHHSHCPSTSSQVLPKLVCSLSNHRSLNTKTPFRLPNMGFGSLFKKSDDKQKPASPAPSSNPYAGPSSAGPSSASNPYAAPSPNPYAQPSPPTQHQPYQQHNSAQFQDNQRASQSSYGAPSQSSYGGLPSGPRPGGLPARGSQGPGAWGSDRDSQGAPPPSYTSVAGAPSTNTSPSVASTVFSRRAPNSNQTSPSLYSGAPSPAFGSNTSSPAIGTGYPSEKYGAADGIGRNRFETPAASRYDQYAPGPSQRPGGYGDLDRAREELFSGYNRNQQTGPSLAQSQSPHFQPGNFPDRQHMTEEELEVAQLNDKIGAEQLAYEDTLGRTLARAEEAEARVDQAHESLSRQEETLDKARIHMAHTRKPQERVRFQSTSVNHLLQTI